MGPVLKMEHGTDRSIGVLPFYHIYGKFPLTSFYAYTL